MHPEMALALHRQREQELLTTLRHVPLAASGPGRRAVPGVGARAVALTRRALVAVGPRTAPVECCPAM